MKRNPFVAIGTGRCGSVSLSKIIDACQFVHCVHEKFVTKWYTPQSKTLNRLKCFLAQSYNSQTLFGEVQPHLLPHLPWLRSSIPDLKVVCLHRPCEEVVKSFMRREPDKLRPSVRGKQKNTKWVYRLPDIEAETAEDAVRCYWTMYEKAMAKITNSFHIEMRELNDDCKLQDLFEFLDIPEKHRIFLPERYYNVGKIP